MDIVLLVLAIVVVWLLCGYSAFIVGSSSDFYQNPNGWWWLSEAASDEWIPTVIVSSMIGPCLWPVAIKDLLTQPEGRRGIIKYGLIFWPDQATERIHIWKGSSSLL